MFTGQYYDSEIDEYYLRARQYDPYISRFTSRDPVLGEFEEPLTLHKYLYCTNDPINKVDPTGQYGLYYHFLDVLSLMFSEDFDEEFDNTLRALEEFRNDIAKDEPFLDSSVELGLNIAAPPDIMGAAPDWECEATEGFYRHCATSCRTNKIIKTPSVTMGLALLQGQDFPFGGFNKDYISDIHANIVGIGVSYIPGGDCRNQCEKASKIYSKIWCFILD